MIHDADVETARWKVQTPRGWKIITSRPSF